MAVVAPTVIASGDGQFVRQQDQTNGSLVSLGGGTRRGNNYLLDGVPITDLRNRRSRCPTMEALEDVKVQVHTYDAELGRTGGGVFNMTARSGSNALHGTGFFQTRPSWGLANNYFSKRAGVPQPNSPTISAAAASAGRSCGTGRSSGSRPRTTRPTPRATSSVRMPTDLERAGDFSQTFDARGNLVVIYDPLTTRTDPSPAAGT